MDREKAGGDKCRGDEEELKREDERRGQVESRRSILSDSQAVQENWESQKAQERQESQAIKEACPSRDRVFSAWLRACDGRKTSGSVEATPPEFPRVENRGRNAGDPAANALSANASGLGETAAEARGTVLAAASGRDEAGVGSEGEEREGRRREGGEGGKRGGKEGGLRERAKGFGGEVEVGGRKSGEYAGARKDGGDLKEHDDAGGGSGSVAVKHARALAWEEYLEEEERRKEEDWDSYGGVWGSTEGDEGLVVWPQSGDEQGNGGESVDAKESEGDEEVVRVPASIRGAAAGRAVLVVVPSSVLGNWQEELNRWGHFRISVFHGAHREAALVQLRSGWAEAALVQLRSGWAKVSAGCRCRGDSSMRGDTGGGAELSAGQLAGGAESGGLREAALVQLRSGWAEVVLTTFDTFRVAADTLCPHPWLMAIVDEVHKLRSYSSALFQCADRINTARRYGLSGTVMQNEFRELWSVLQWVRRGYLGSLKEFNERYSDPLRLGQRKGAPQPLVARAQARQAELVRALARVLLRRHKDDLQGSLKLPGKRDMIVVCPMTSLQRRVYQRCLKLPDFQLLSRKDEPCR
ncbi:unnamed protein product [Closterium sp. NIES-64]|nr:unnamed protein product [Closterium sp. NIES-64]